MSLKIVTTKGTKSDDTSIRASAAGAPIKRTTRPMVTGSSVIGMRCKDGVILACDTLASYGSMARFRQITRMHKVTDTCVIGAGGDYSDFQQLTSMLDQIILEEECMDDGHSLSPKSIHQFLSRVMYNRRNKMDPLWNSVVLAGMQDEKPLLALVDLYGTNFESEVIATGYGCYIGLPLLRNAYREDITVTEARTVITDVLKVLYYRDCRTIDKYQIATVTKDGATVEDAKRLETEWSYKAFVDGARGGDVSTW